MYNFDECKTHFNFPSYYITTDGDIISKKTGRKMTPIITSKGYQKVFLINASGIRKERFVHRLVAECFIPHTDERKDQVNHINGVKSDNRVSNLEWVTNTENMSHVVKNDYMRVRKVFVRQMDLNGNFIAIYNSISEASKLTGADESTISKCCRGKRNSAKGYKWAFVSSEIESAIRSDVALDNVGEKPFSQCDEFERFLIKSICGKCSCGKAQCAACGVKKYISGAKGC